MTIAKGDNPSPLAQAAYRDSMLSLRSLMWHRDTAIVKAACSVIAGVLRVPSYERTEVRRSATTDPALHLC